MRPIAFAATTLTRHATLSDATLAATTTRTQATNNPAKARAIRPGLLMDRDCRVIGQADTDYRFVGAYDIFPAQGSINCPRGRTGYAVHAKAITSLRAAAHIGAQHTSEADASSASVLA
jgi:hypothetical protein